MLPQHYFLYQTPSCLAYARKIGIDRKPIKQGDQIKRVKLKVMDYLTKKEKHTWQLKGVLYQTYEIKQKEHGTKLKQTKKCIQTNRVTYMVYQVIVT